MARKKQFKDAIAIYDNVSDDTSRQESPELKMTRPEKTTVHFDENSTGRRKYDFAEFYGVNIDAITRPCQQAIEIMLEEPLLSHATVVAYCSVGMDYFLPFCQLWASALQRPMTLDDINDTLVENYISYLKDLDHKFTTQKNIYTTAKSVLKKLGKFKWLNDEGIYPKNPYPQSNRKSKGQRALSKNERRRFVEVLKKDLHEVLAKTEPLTANELSLCVMAIALRSGLNPTPLIELPVNCLQTHPLKSNRKLLVSYKRRGNSTHIQSMRYSEDVELMTTVMPDVVEIIEVVRKRNHSLREESATYHDNLFVYSTFIQKGAAEYRITTVSKANLNDGIKTYLSSWQLKDDHGEPLKINIMRLRKTFENRLWQLSGQDPWVVAKMAGHSIQVSDTHYLEAPETAEKDFHLMGEIRTQELLEANNISALPAENTPVSKCRDITNGQFAPKKNHTPCTNFLSCVRCRSFVVTEEDLYRLFSFYWLLVYEREHIGARRWSRYFAHIIRIIDNEIVPKFDAKTVENMKAKAKATPHPFWKNRDQLSGGMTA